MDLMEFVGGHSPAFPEPDNYRHLLEPIFHSLPKEDPRIELQTTQALPKGHAHH